MKKVWVSAVAFLFSVFFFSNLAYGSEHKSYDEMSSNEVENILVEKMGHPKDRIVEMTEDMKKDLINSYFESDGELKYNSTEYIEYMDTPTGLQKVSKLFEKGVVQPFGVIGTSSLGLAISVYDANVSGVSYKRIYLDWNWKKDLNSIKNDRVGMAIASGWEIRGGSGVCSSSAKYGNWTNTKNCGGRVMNSSIYGYSWDIGAGIGDGVVGRHSGFARFDARKVQSSALNRVSAEYGQDASTLNNMSIGVSWGPASITYTGGSNLNTAGVDKTW